MFLNFLSILLFLIPSSLVFHYRLKLMFSLSFYYICVTLRWLVCKYHNYVVIRTRSLY